MPLEEQILILMKSNDTFFFFKMDFGFTFLAKKFLLNPK